MDNLPGYQNCERVYAPPFPLVSATIQHTMPETTILIVEDNPTNLRLVTTVLRRLPAQILTAVDGEKGVETARASLPQLILMDLELPGINGLEALHLLKSDPRTAIIPVVALSGNSSPEEKEAALRAGCIGYIEKPFDLHTFPTTIQGYLAG